MQESRMTEFNLTRSCSFLDSPISRSIWWNIDLKVLQRTGLLAGRDAEWTISSANKNRWRRQGAESSITGNKAKITQDAFFPPVTCYISGQRTGGQEMHTTNSPTTGVCSRLLSSMSLGQTVTRQQGENTHMSSLITHTHVAEKYPINSCTEIITVYPSLVGKHAKISRKEMSIHHPGIV